LVLLRPTKIVSIMALLKTLLAIATPGLMPMVWAKPVYFDISLTWEQGAPDGNVRQMVFMNEQFPGPELRLDQGDDVEVSQKGTDIRTTVVNLPPS
jgi:hypothetical protein